MLLRSAIALSFGTALAAQTVCLTGVLEPVTGPTICQQGETHRFRAANVYLKSSRVNLGAHVGATVEVTGVDVGLLCRVIDVSQVTDPAPVQMTTCGTAMIGCQIKVKVSGPGLGIAALAASAGRAFTPLGCGGAGPTGTVLLGQPIVFLVSGTTGTGSVDVTATIPLNNAFVGVPIWFQGAHMTIGPIGPLVTSDVLQIVPVPLLPPCGPLNC